MCKHLRGTSVFVCCFFFFKSDLLVDSNKIFSLSECDHFLVWFLTTDICFSFCLETSPYYHSPFRCCALVWRSWGNLRCDTKLLA